jgi:hypothetical protein
MRELSNNCGRNDNSGKESREYIRGINENKIVQWASIADDFRHLSAEMTQSLPVADELFRRVLQFNTTILEKRVDFHRSLQTE